MKYTLTLLFVAIAKIAFCQTTDVKPAKPALRHWGIGGNVGAVIPVLEKEYKNVTINLGYSIGFVLNYSPNKFLTLEFRPSFMSQSGYTNVQYTDVVGNIVSSGKFTSYSSNIMLPVLADIHNPEFLQGHVYAGGFYSRLVDVRYKMTNSPVNTNAVTKDNTTQWYVDNGYANNGGVVLGAGLGYHPGNYAIVLQYMFFKRFGDTAYNYRSNYHNIGLSVLFYLHKKEEKK